MKNLRLFRGKKVIWGVTEDGFKMTEGSILVDSGKITATSTDYTETFTCSNEQDVQVIDAGDMVLMPGIIDSHVHVNEPGRTQWEGYETATKAAATGGITTIVDMPLNCIPATTTMEALKTKMTAAEGKCYVDVALWGGIVPGNKGELKEMVKCGVVGFKCFLINSGVDEFQHVDDEDVEEAMIELQGTDTVILFHAEKACDSTADDHRQNGDPMKYETFLNSRPEVMEVEAIKTVVDLCRKYRVRCHVVHLSAAGAIKLISDAKEEGLPITVETCHHYLNIAAEQVPDGATQFKCCPPIRNKKNQEQLWAALDSGVIDMVVSDHSPCTTDLKKPGELDFTTAWGGISSVQFGLSLMWTALKDRGASFEMLHRLMTLNTAKLCRLTDRKGSIGDNKDADFVIWDPEATIDITEEMIQHKNKLTPYLGRKLYGRVMKTVVRGNVVYDDGKVIEQPTGNILINRLH